MKNLTFRIIGIVLLSIMVVACSSLKETKTQTKGRQVNMFMSEAEQEEWSIKNDTIYHDSTALGYIQNIEWEYLDGDKIRMEISIASIGLFGEKTVDIFRYIHARQPNAKIEINTDSNKLDE